MKAQTIAGQPEDHLHLDIFENSNSFALEAVTKAQANIEDLRSWKFAIVHMVQALELAFKEILRREHPLLLFKDIDRRTQTVDLQTAIDRLQASIKVKLNEQDKATILDAQKIRNEILHFRTNLSIPKARLLFAKLFALLDHLHLLHFTERYYRRLPPELQNFVFSNQSILKEIQESAHKRIKLEQIDSNFVLHCPFCDTAAFVIYDAIDECYVCGHTEESAECPRCHEFFLKNDLRDFSEKFEYSHDEGRIHLENNFGYGYDEACMDCIEHIQIDIEEQRDEINSYCLNEENL